MQRPEAASPRGGAGAVLALAGLSTAGAFAVDLPIRHTGKVYGRFHILALPRRACTTSEIGTAGSAEGWHSDCAPGLTKNVECNYTGFQYSMEWYFAALLRGNPRFLAADLKSARFIFFPHCVSQVYFAFRHTFNLSHWDAIEAAEAEYLIPLLRWAHGSPLHQRHGGHNFWTVFSMDLGRQDFPHCGPWLQNWSVGSLSGDPRWLLTSSAWFRSPRVARNGSGPGGACWRHDVASTTLGTGRLPARDFHPQDTVISIPSRFHLEPRAQRFDGRRTLAFFAGSPNSCSRKRLLRLYRGATGFDLSTHIHNSSEYRSRMLRSRYCLVLRGSSHTNSVRLYDIIAHGCVPVIVSDDFHPPLDRWLPWQDLAIFLPSSSIPHLGHILREEVGEAQRWHLFQNLVLGFGSSAETETGSYWTGLSAASVFDWDRGQFWLLFLHDLVRKLDARLRS